MLREDEAELSPPGVLEAVARPDQLSVGVVERLPDNASLSAEGQPPIRIERKAPVASTVRDPLQKRGA